MAGVPEYMKIMRHVLDLSLDHSDADSRIMSERELAARFNVARTTVRKALKSLLDADLIYVKPGLGMFVNSMKWGKRKCKTWRVGFAFGGGQNVDIDGIHLWLLERLCESLRRFPARLKVLNFSGRDVDSEEEFELYKSDAIIWFRPDPGVKSLIGSLRKRVHVEIVGSSPSGDPCSVAVDLRKGGRLAAEWLFKRGLRKPLFVGMVDNPSFKDVLAGWRDAFSDAGIPFDPKSVVSVSRDLAGDAAKLLKEADGAFCFNLFSTDFFSALHSAGKEGLPFLLDADFTYEPEGSLQPAARLFLAPSSLTDRAAERVFLGLTGGAPASSELVLEPEIRED